MSAACISTPVSWLRLERFALDAGDSVVGEHVAACPACKHCLDEIRSDVVALPPLAVPERVTLRARFRWWFAAPALLAAAAVLVLVLRPGKPDVDVPPELGNVATVKGIGEVTLGVVRDRGGTIRDDVATFRATDRWKVEITCASANAVWIDVAVVEAGATVPDHPLAPVQLPCGNKIVAPGAFVLTGSKANRVCVRAAADIAPRRALPEPGQPDVACVTVTPER